MLIWKIRKIMPQEEYYCPCSSKDQKLAIIILGMSIIIIWMKMEEITMQVWVKVINIYKEVLKIEANLSIIYSIFYKVMAFKYH